MTRQLSVTEAQTCLEQLVRHLEHGEPVELTHDGEVIAAIISARDYRRVVQPLHPADVADFWDALQRWRSEADLDAIWADGDPLAGVRDRTTDGGREFHW